MSTFNKIKYEALLKELEVTEVSLLDLEEGLRFDAELYQKKHRIFQEFIKTHSVTTFAKEAITVKKGIFDIKSECYADEGIPFVRISNLKEMVIDTEDIIYIPESENEKNLDTFLQRNDIILSKTASPAASLVSIPYCNTSQDTVAIKLKPNSQINSHFIVAYLNSSYGLAMMKRWFSGNIQMHLNLDGAKNNLIIPVMNSGLQNQIRRIFELGLTSREEAKNIFNDIDDLVNHELNLHDFKPSQNNTKIKSFNDSFLLSGRLDAEYYQEKYEQIEKKIKQYNGGWCVVGNKFVQNLSIFSLDKEAYNYVEISDVSTSNGSTKFNSISAENLPANAKINLYKDDLIVSKVRPYRGAVAIIDFDDEDLVGSGAFTVLQEFSDYKKETLAVLLRNEFYKELMMQQNVGSSYPVIKDEDIMNLPIPILPDDMHKTISEQIQKSYSLRKKSEFLFNSVILATEMAIEVTEDTALNWLSKII